MAFTIASVILALPSMTIVLRDVGCTLWVKMITMRFLSRSAHTEVPV